MCVEFLWLASRLGPPVNSVKTHLRGATAQLKRCAEMDLLFRRCTPAGRSIRNIRTSAGLHVIAAISAARYLVHMLHSRVLMLQQTILDRIPSVFHITLWRSPCLNNWTNHGQYRICVEVCIFLSVLYPVWHKECTIISIERERENEKHEHTRQNNPN